MSVEAKKKKKSKSLFSFLEKKGLALAVRKLNTNSFF